MGLNFSLVRIKNCFTWCQNSKFFLGLILLIAILIRLINIDVQSPWVDETFSLAMATGHSLEGEVTDPSDYTDSFIPLPATHYLSYLKPAGGVLSIISAVERSDTSPPLYYILLRGWISIFGISVLSAKLFSLFLTLTALICLYNFGNILSKETALISSLFFAVSPLIIYILSEIRMYGLLVTITILLILITYKISFNWNNKINWLLWAAVNVCGFYTHYMFCSVFLASNLFLLISICFNKKNGSSYAVWLVSGTISLLLFLIFIPSVIKQFSSARITAAWLNVDNSIWDLLELLFSSLGNMVWKSEHDPVSGVIVSVIFISGIFMLKKRSDVALLLSLFFFIPLLFLLSFDLVRSTQQMGQIRYFVLASPPLFIALAVSISKLSKSIKSALIILLTIFLSIQSLFLINWKYNQWEPFHQTADFINDRAEEDDLVIIRSIPSGVISLCLYLKEKTRVISISKHINENMIKELVDILPKENEGGIWFVTAHTNWSEDYQKTETVIDTHIKKRGKAKVMQTLGRGKGIINITYYR